MPSRTSPPKEQTHADHAEGRSAPNGKASAKHRPPATPNRTPKEPTKTARATADLQLLKQLARAPENTTLSVNGHELRLTHLNRIYWPKDERFNQDAITKRDLLLYLIAMSPMMLPHLEDRPLTLFRWPGGIAAKRTLVKHWDGAMPPFIERVQIFSETKGHDDEYMLCNNLATLMWLAQHGTLEVHIWHSRVSTGPDSSVRSTTFSGSARRLEESIIEYPDYILFDIDPYIYSGKESLGSDPEPHAAAFQQGKRVAFWLKELLEGIELQSFVKTTGKTGLHVVVPIRRDLKYSAVREVARTIGQHLLRDHPNEVTTEWSTENRRGKIFIDYNMNVRGKSTSAPYCPRGLPGAPVSMPLTWKELKETADPFEFRLSNIFAKPVTRDAWRGVFELKQDLSEILTASRP